MMEILRRTYSLYGFTPLDTPVIESADVLLAKGGGETEKQIYRFTKGDADLALRFDLTVPLAKYVALHAGELSFPFRRYQIGKVYRGERAQRGRFREFYQADIDIIGDGKLDITNEAEIPSIIYQTFSTLGLKRFQIRVNNRKILNGFYALLGLTEKSGDIMRTVDKLDKIGADGVAAELREKGMPESAVEALSGLLSKGKLTLDDMAQYCSEDAKETLEQLRTIIETADKLSDGYTVEFDPSLVRGQGYYTGTVFEVASKQFGGTVAGGGRYDNLIGRFTGDAVPAVGFSIGFERIFSIVTENNIQLAGSRKKTAILHSPESILEAIAKSNELQADSDVTLIAAANRKKADKAYSKAKQQGFDEIIKIGL